MKKHSLSVLPIILLFILTGCKKEDELSKGFNDRWQVYYLRVLKTGFNEACNYEPKPSDFYHKPVGSICQSDDIYDFTDPDSLTIYSGNNKCWNSEPEKVTKSYDKQGDQIIIDGEIYAVVMLARDTLILANCEPLNLDPPGGFGKIGTKFIRKK